jgi:hypothetical protein
VPSLEVMLLSTLYADCNGNIDKRMRMHIHSASVALTYRGGLRARWNAALVGLIVVLLHVCGTLVYCLMSRSRVSSSHQEISGSSTEDDGGTHSPGCVRRLAASVAGAGSPSSGWGCPNSAGGPGSGGAESRSEHVDGGCVDGLAVNQDEG